MSQIQAAVCHHFAKPLQIETVELRAPLSNEVEVQLGAVAICHSDIAFVEGAWGGDLPAVYGHEAAGVVTEVGDAVQGSHRRRSRGGDPTPQLWTLPPTVPPVVQRSVKSPAIHSVH